MRRIGLRVSPGEVGSVWGRKGVGLGALWGRFSRPRFGGTIGRACTCRAGHAATFFSRRRAGMCRHSMARRWRSKRTQSKPSPRRENPSPCSANAVSAPPTHSRPCETNPMAVAASAAAADATAVAVTPQVRFSSRPPLSVEETPGGWHTFEPPLLRLVRCVRFAAARG